MAKTIERKVNIPVLETPRIVLRPHELTDFDAYVALWADPVVTRFIGGRPHTRDEAWQRLLRHAGLWTLLGYGFWAIEEKETRRLIGEAGFFDLKRPIEPSFEGSPEAGWALLPDTHGKGLATEIVSATLAWGDRHFDAPRTVCIIDPDNVASLRVAEKTGFREIASVSYRDTPTIILERPRGEAIRGAGGADFPAGTSGRRER